MINIIAALAGTLYAAYTDIKSGDVPDWLSHAMIALGFIWTLFNYSFDKLIWIWGTAALVFGIGYLMYIFGQVGGGDVKLFTAISLLIPFYSHEIYPFVVSVFLLSGILFMMVMPVQYFKKVIEKKKEIQDFKKKLTTLIIYEIILVAFAVFWYFKFGLLAILILPLMVASLIMPFKDDVVKLFFAQKKMIEKINEEDVIALELLDKDVKKKLKLWRKTLTIPEINALKKIAQKENITEIIVCENLPKYVPYIFISLVLNLIFGDMLMLFFQNLF